MWIVYSMGLMLFEYKVWGMMPYCMLSILIYPLLYKDIDEADTAE